VSSSAPTVYRLAPAFVARLLGLALVGLAVLLVVGTTVVAVAGLSPDLLVVVALVAVVAAIGFGWWLRNRAWVLRCTDDGYRVRLVRGTGVTEARWSAVEDAVTTYRRDVACLELRLRDGRTTTIPVGVLDVDKERFVREVQERLQRGHGLRPLP
jgi:apolipoprotein N-acyltransferase